MPKTERLLNTPHARMRKDITPVLSKCSVRLERIVLSRELHEGWLYGDPYANLPRHRYCAHRDVYVRFLSPTRMLSTVICRVSPCYTASLNLKGAPQSFLRVNIERKTSIRVLLPCEYIAAMLPGSNAAGQGAASSRVMTWNVCWRLSDQPMTLYYASMT